VDGGAIEPRTVEIGLDNNRMVRIMRGLREGEVVLLTPPLKSAALEPSKERIGTEAAPLEQDTEVYRIIDDKLQNKTNGQQQDGTDRRSGDSGRDSLSPDQRQKMRREFENMPAEEREKLRERFKNMSPEEREKMRQRRKGGNR
jgi:hypothetical protein